jgi:hypothetical protein
MFSPFAESLCTKRARLIGRRSFVALVSYLSSLISDQNRKSHMREAVITSSLDLVQSTIEHMMT